MPFWQPPTRNDLATTAGEPEQWQDLFEEPPIEDGWQPNLFETKRAREKLDEAEAVLAHHQVASDALPPVTETNMYDAAVAQARVDSAKEEVAKARKELDANTVEWYEQWFVKGKNRKSQLPGDASKQEELEGGASEEKPDIWAVLANARRAMYDAQAAMDDSAKEVVDAVMKAVACAQAKMTSSETVMDIDESFADAANKAVHAASKVGGVQAAMFEVVAAMDNDNAFTDIEMKAVDAERAGNDAQEAMANAQTAIRKAKQKNEEIIASTWKQQLDQRWEKFWFGKNFQPSSEARDDAGKLDDALRAMARAQKAVADTEAAIEAAKKSVNNARMADKEAVDKTRFPLHTTYWSNQVAGEVIS